MHKTTKTLGTYNLLHSKPKSVLTIKAIERCVFFCIRKRYDVSTIAMKRSFEYCQSLFFIFLNQSTKKKF